MNDDSIIKDVKNKIDREKRLLSGATAIRQTTDNPAVQSQSDGQIRDARRNIEYLESRMRELQLRKSSSGGSRGAPSSSQSNSGPPSSSSSQQQLQQQRGGGYANGPQHSPYGGQGAYGSHSAGYGNPGPGGYSDLNNNNRVMPARGPFSPGAPNAPSSKTRPNYTRLDLIKADTPYLGARTQLMVSQLEFKLSVEKQYKEGIQKLVGIYKLDGDKKIREEAKGRQFESLQKIQLLSRALKRYENLQIDMQSGADAADDDSLNAPSMRKPLTGNLLIRIHAVKDVEHRVGSKISRGPETFVIMKVEDEFKARTKATKLDRWTDEQHDFDIDKGNEVELTIYDKAFGDNPVPVGMIWIRISDIAEEMRRKKIESEFNNAGWVSADRTLEDASAPHPDLHFNPPPGAAGFNGPQQSGAGNNAESSPVMIDSWFSLEPAGSIHLSMTFAKQTRERKNYDAGLNRKNAIRQRKEDIHELYGHKFVAQQFYNIMRCALCGELLKYATGMQCSDCKYLCHEKCYSLVVTKCISKSNAESDPDEAKLNHRIPHRFETFANIGANWCCHCGYILPLGRKSAKRCRECHATCHADCTHLLPDFCGMSMKDANHILGEIKRARVNQGSDGRGKQSMMDRTLRPPGKEPKARPQTQPTPSYQTSEEEAKLERYSYGNDQPSASSLQQQIPSPSPRQSSTNAHKAAVTSFATGTPGGRGTTQQSQTRPAQPPRSESQSSTMAAAAAANALASRNPLETRQSSQSGKSQTPPYPQSPTEAPVPGHSQYNPIDYVNVDRAQQTSMPRMQATQPSQIPTSQPAPSSYQPRQYHDLQQEQQQQQQQQQLQQQPQPRTTTLAQQQSPQKSQPPQQRGRTRVGLDHFNFLAVLGKGNFGKVMLAETKTTKQLYAIKVLKKEFIIENDEVESTKSERDVYIIANKAKHPFLLSLHACFQTETRVYFVMEYISGGDLMLHIQKGHFGPKRAQFYAAEVLLALKYFHENGVIYRDLKLDNILLTLDGHIKIADYGLCKKDMYYGSTTKTFCGTPEFMAPEILLDKPYGRAVDWWAFGVLIYQMLLQQSPFRGEDEDEIYDAILTDEPLYPIHMPRDSVSILQKLLTREPELRLGSGPTDAQELMSHSYFRNINWDEIYNKRVEAPFLPTIKNATDTSNFDSEFTSVTPVLTPVQSVLLQSMQEQFRGFSYSADFV